ncbi:DUF1330 domain-containing protein [Roseateles sp. L2-2]|uniref:DUF1330 domain-containing protein n=1 Tax=Roseateles TaxID=93681 RepID=UPI003D36A461
MSQDSSSPSAAAAATAGTTAAKPAYIFFIKEATLDADEMAKYGAAVGATFDGHDVQVLAAYDAHEVVEGAPMEGVVLLAFPSLEAARAWYFSPAYQAAAQHRFRGAKYRAVITEGRVIG